MKHLYRTEKNKVFYGVMSGLGEYYQIDPVILRVFWITITVFTGVVPGIIIYLLAALVIPKKAR